MSQQRPNAIAGYEDWADYVLAGGAAGGEAPTGGLAEVLAPPAAPTRLQVSHGAATSAEGVRTLRLSWQLGYGPATAAYLCTPEGADGPLPSILLMHCHSGNKWVGAERLVDLGEQDAPESLALRAQMYGGQAVANHLAGQGFAVLAHDAFVWGSRAFTFDPRPARADFHLQGQMALWREQGEEATPERIYNTLAADHEHTVAKVALMLGTTFAGMVAHDDLAALTVLASLPMVDVDRIGTMGLSGGGGRAMLLASLSPRIRAHLVAGMMFTFDSLLPAHIDAHSWLMYSPGILRYSEWPLIPTHAPTRQAMHVQFASRDALFSLAGMRAADAMLRAADPAAVEYSSSWFDEPHRMTPQMQDDAAAFFTRALG